MTATKGYEPAVPMQAPPLFRWPPRPLKALWIMGSRVIWPYGLFFIVLAAVVWNFFTPAMDRMESFHWRWMAEIYVRNVVILVAFVGALHLRLHIRRDQAKDFKYNDRWLSTTNRAFLWNNQTKDNVFWCLTSGAFFWSAFEWLLMWAYAGDRIPQVDWSDAPVYLAAMTFLAFFIEHAYFYVNHRILHWGPLYRHAHYLHHKNVNTGPWTGIAMHPIEHLFYFATPIVYLVIPVSPFIVILTQIVNGLGPAPSHSGFDRIVLPGNRTMPAGDYFHYLHHRYFECNYGTLAIPIDEWAGTYHDGTPEAHEHMRARRARAGDG